MITAIIFEGWLAQFLGLLLVAALLSSRPPTTANRLLAAAILCAVYRQFLLTLQISGSLASLPPLFRTSFPFQMLAIPMFYLYVKALTSTEFKLGRKHAIHLLPFAAGLAWDFAVPVAGDGAVLHLYARVVVKVLVTIPYLIHAHRQVRAFARESQNHRSDLTDLRLSWLRILLVVVYAVIGVDALDVITGPQIPLWYLVPPVGVLSLMALALFSLRISPVFARETQQQKQVLALEARAAGEENGEEKKESSRLSDEQLDRQKERLTEVLENQSLYLNPELRLSDLAAALHVRPYRVSEILSRGLQTSFYDLINLYRVTHAQKLLSSPNSSFLNLLGIAMESGFKSKSVFNDAFRKATGMTPSEFRMGKKTESLDSDDRIARSGR
jgi:AraC-like DNA-binding protein